jgi:hypothetical protein
MSATATSTASPVIPNAMKRLLASTAAFFVPCVAFAQVTTTTVGPAPSNAWSADLTNALIGMATVVLPIVGGMLVQALRKLAAKWDLEGTAQNTANTEADIKAALNVGITKVLPLIEAQGWSSPAVRMAILMGATDYLKQRFPDRTKAIVAAAQPASASDPAVPSAVAIKETLAARLPDAMTAAAASPATPPAPLDPIGAAVVKV